MRTARVVVIDEDKDDAIPILRALGQVGLGAVYFPGDDFNDLPETPLSGIRVVFLDLNLNGQMEAKQYIPYAVQVLKRCVKCQPRTTGIVVWTRHTDEIDTLLETLASEEIHPAYVKTIDGKGVLTGGGTAAQDLVTQLRAQLEEEPSRHLLFDWEQTVHDAATKAVDVLFQMSTGGDDLTKILAAIAQAAADEKIKTPPDALAALGAGLVSVHADAVEDFEYLPAQADHGSNAVLHKMIETLRTDRPTPEQRARLNSFLLTTSSSVLRPGNVYATAASGLPGIGLGSQLRGFITEIYFQQRSKSDKPWWKKFVDDMAEASVPACIEITPACDHAAQKTPVARLLMGILIRMDTIESLEADARIPAECRLFARDVESIWLHPFHDKPAGVYKLVVSARRFMTLPVEAMEKIQPVIRLRHPVVTDIQSWFASHASRPGYASVH